MKRSEFKSMASGFLKKMALEWFEDKPIMKGLGISLIDANINKFDNLIQLFEDENGSIDINGMIKNIDTNPIKIDLSAISPILPNRVILIDLNDFLNYVNTEQNR